MASETIQETKSKPDLTPRSWLQHRNTILALLLAVLTLAVYNPVVHNEFINIDDNGYLVDNAHVHAGLHWTTVKWAFTTYTCENWHPLTWVSHALDWQLFGTHAAGHHYMSVLFHVINVVLLFWLLQSATGFPWRSLIVAALFAVHPVNVESVVWAAERKNVLSMMFFLLAMLAYNEYAERPSLRRYGLVAALFACGLMAKPQVVTFPFVLLLWDYWPLHRFGPISESPQNSRFARASFHRLVLEKLPLLLLSAADSLLTMQAQHNAVRTTAVGFPVSVRLENAAVAYMRYVGHAFWPFNLSPAYPHPFDTIPLRQIVAAAIFLTLVTALVLASRKRYLVVGWFWFIGILVPMIGLVQVGDQAMADRYAYIPFIALFWMATWAFAEVGLRRRISSRWLAIPACVGIVGSAVLTHRQIAYWHDSETLWKYALQVTPRNFMAHTYYGALLTLENRHEEAIEQYRAAEQLRSYPLDQVGLFADYELRHGHFEDALRQAQQVVTGQTNPKARELAFRDLGVANTKLGKFAEAQKDYQSALQIDPKDSYAYTGLGLVAFHENGFKDAAVYFSRAVAIEPDDLGYFLLGTALAKDGHTSEAAQAFAQARKISPNMYDVAQRASAYAGIEFAEPSESAGN